MQNISDGKLERYIKNFKEASTTENKIYFYKKATDRLNYLKTNYNNLCGKLTIGTIPAVKKTKLKLDDLVTELNILNENLDNNQTITELIETYVQHQQLIKNLDIETTKIKNEIFKVHTSMSDIIISKFNSEI